MVGEGHEEAAYAVGKQAANARIAAAAAAVPALAFANTGTVDAVAMVASRGTAAVASPVASPVAAPIASTVPPSVATTVTAPIASAVPAAVASTIAAAVASPVPPSIPATIASAGIGESFDGAEMQMKAVQGRNLQADRQGRGSNGQNQ
jgi:hypothetical protein